MVSIESVAPMSHRSCLIAYASRPVKSFTMPSAKRTKETNCFTGPKIIPRLRGSRPERCGDAEYGLKGSEDADRRTPSIWNLLLARAAFVRGN
jgi:hypothetical protein